MTILTERDYYKPFEYPEAFEFWLTQQQSFWLHTEINMERDITDWKFNLTDDERLIVGNILKSFIQSEVLIGDYWRFVAKAFPKPEIGMMAAAFSNMESIHIAAYAYLNDTLGLQDFQAFLEDKVAMERLEILTKPPKLTGLNTVSGRRELARSLAVFSAFAEGVALFSAFTVLLSFSQRGLMKGLGEVIEMSIRDESLHAKGGVWLYRKFMEENQDIGGIKREVYEAARACVQIEHKFIDSVFDGRTLPNCAPGDLKEFIKQRANDKLRELGLKDNYRAVDVDAINRLSWFNLASAGDQHADFFASRVTQYAKTDQWETMWEGIGND
ncbi:MAG: ribonucleotide-diphosphate reductase subunit beta [Chitinophagaceae bacterium]|nr:ribonucleotide-diphosphate reductase subunit beta [Chitinophagaceae bacterium]